MNLLVWLWQAFADNGTMLKMEADAAEDPKTKAVLEAAAQYNADEKARIEAALESRGKSPEQYSWEEE